MTTIKEITLHESRITGKTWRTLNSVYYDCHVVSLAQILPKELYYPWLTLTALPFIESQWRGLSCRNALDSEHKRDEVLFDQMGLSKQLVPITGDLEQQIQSTVEAQEYCICRVDSYYHEHFDEFYLKEHRTNGHKVTVIDWDDEYYYGIDNLGIKTLVMAFRRDWFIESVRSNLFHVYEKEDTFYYLPENSIASAMTQLSNHKTRVTNAIAHWVTHRVENADAFNTYSSQFSEDLETGMPRVYAQVHNSYTTALMIETAYTAILESWIYDPTPWQEVLPSAQDVFEALSTCVKAWRMFKMQCRSRDIGATVSDKQLLTILNQVVEKENFLTTLVRQSPVPQSTKKHTELV